MSKFKLKKKACIRAVIVAGFVAVVAAGAYSIAYAESYRDAEVKTMQPSLFTVLQSAYVDNAKLIAELTTKRIEAFGMADDAIENYNDVITDEQKDVLHASEDMMMNALSISEYEKHLSVFNGVIKACETERARIEAERIEAKKKAEEKAARKAEEQKKQEAAQQSQQTQQKQPQQNQSYDTPSGNGVLTPSKGVNWFNGHKETYYNLDMSGVIANAHAMGIQGDYWVRGDGVKMFGGYVIVAAQLEKGTIVATSLGTGIVLDYCPAGTYDLAVTW